MECRQCENNKHTRLRWLDIFFIYLFICISHCWQASNNTARISGCYQQKKVTSGNKHPSVWLSGPKEGRGEDNTILWWWNPITISSTGWSGHISIKVQKRTDGAHLCFLCSTGEKGKDFLPSRPKKRKWVIFTFGSKKQTIDFDNDKMTVTWGQMRDDYTVHFSPKSSPSFEMYAGKFYSAPFQEALWKPLLCEKKKKRNARVRDSFGSTQKRWALNINLFCSPAGDADQNLPYAIMRHLNGWKSALVLELWITEL